MTGAAELTRERIAYETAVAALKNQDDSLNQLRARTGVLLAAGSITASFLGGQALTRGGFGFFTGVAVIAFVLSISACIYVLAPKTGISFSLSGTNLYVLLEAKKNDEAAMYLQLVDWLEGLWNQNQEKIDRGLARWFVAASVALLVEMACWAVALGSTI